jgi:hypothetical protein
LIEKETPQKSNATLQGQFLRFQIKNIYHYGDDRSPSTNKFATRNGFIICQINYYESNTKEKNSSLGSVLNMTSDSVRSKELSTLSTIEELMKIEHGYNCVGAFTLMLAKPFEQVPLCDRK